MKKAIAFDLDGTLVDTLRDIRKGLNEALKSLGYPYSYSLKETKGLIGEGTLRLCYKALQEEATMEKAEELKVAYMPLYEAFQLDHSKPYNGMPETLGFLSNRGYKLFVFSNKPDPLAKILVAHFFPDLFLEVIGASDETPRKPDPSGMVTLLEEYGLKREELLYVGDSLPDVELSENLGCECALCKWGYGRYKKDLLARATYVLEKPKDLVKVLAYGEAD